MSLVSAKNWARPWYGAMVLLALALLSPYLVTGFYQDDSINSLFPSYLRARELSLGPFIWTSIVQWATHEARLFPLTLAVMYSVWYFVRDLVVYRLIQVGLVLSNLFLFAQVIRSLGGSLKLSCLAVVMVLGLFQLRDFHDPVASYAFMMQMTLGLGLGSIFWLKRFDHQKNLGYLAASLVLYTCALLYYEADFTFVPILFYLAARPLDEPRPQAPIARYRYRILAPYLAVTAAYLGTIVFLRWGRTVPYEGIQSNFRWKALATFVFQLSAALPLSYPVFGRSGFYTLKTLVSREFWSGGMLGVLVASVLILRRIFSMESRPELKPELSRRRDLFWLGWLLTLVPAVLVALSQKYQNQVTRPGIGYLPVYFSCFGVALLLALAVEKTSRPRLVSGLVAGVLAFTFSANWIAADRLNRYWKYPRVLLEQALQRGFFADLPEHARLVLDFRYDWATPDFFQHYGGRKFEMVGADTYRLDRGQHPAHDYLLRAEATGVAGGEVSLAPIERVDPADRIVTTAPPQTLHY